MVKCNIGLIEESVSSGMEINKGAVEKIIEQVGDVFYLFDSKMFDNNCKKVEDAFRKYYKNFRMAYSCKTNYLPECIRIVSDRGGFLEIVSEMELEMVHRCGVLDKDVIWNGPIKSYEKLTDFLISGGLVNIDNIEEWRNIEIIAANNLEKEIRVGIRCCFDVGDGTLSRFGIDVNSDLFDYILKSIASKENIRLICLQCHYAKRDASLWVRRSKELLQIYNYVTENYNLWPEIIDLGGGISGNMNEAFAKQLSNHSLGVSEFARNSAKIINDYFIHSDNKPKLVIEPGTCICADSMSLLFTIYNIRNNCGRYIATSNASQKLISMQGLNPPIHVIHNGNVDEFYECIDIAGYTCIESDYLYKGYNGVLSVGDYVILQYCGSYSIVNKPPFILPNIPIVDISDGIENMRMLRRSETVDDIMISYL